MANPDGPMLAIETATSSGSVAVGGPAGVIVEISLNVRGSHSSALVPAIDHALSMAGMSAGDLGGVAVGSGPGSFTGIRIAGATAKGIVHALKVPLHAFSSLQVAAAGWAGRGSTVLALFDARGRDVFAGCYRFADTIEIVSPPAPMTLDQAIAVCTQRQVDVVTGDGVVRHGPEVEERTGAMIAPAHLAYPRAASLLWLAGADPAGSVVRDPATWEPDYLRPSGAERIAQERAATRGASEES